jgi:enediyne biosynthesis protein E4
MEFHIGIFDASKPLELRLYSDFMLSEVRAQMIFEYFRQSRPIFIYRQMMRWVLSCVFLAGWACRPLDRQPLFLLANPEKTGIKFENRLIETEEDNVLNYEYFYNGGGIAAADFNLDGRVDLFFTGNQVPNVLYLQTGKCVFTDISLAALPQSLPGTWHTGVTVVDINQDQWPDLYISVSGNIEHPERRKNKLYINKGLARPDDSTSVLFEDQAGAYGLDLITFSTQAAFFDYDRDGDLDVYILNHNVKDFKRFDVEAIRFMRDSLAGHRLMRNDGGKFQDVSIAAGIKGNPIGFGLGIHVADLNDDQWPDLYISNDYLEEDYLYINNQDGTFRDEIKDRTRHISYFSMGNEIADLNNDMLPDIITTDMLPEDNRRQKLLFGPDKYEAYLSMLKGGIHPSFMRNMLQLNNGDGTFSEIGQLAGISNTDWTWSPWAADFDNDGHKDLFFSNGYLRDYTNMDFMKYYADASVQAGIPVKNMVEKMPSTRIANYIFKNLGNLQFENKQKSWGLNQPVISNGALAVDLDLDGDLDLVTNNLNAPASLYINQTDKRKNSNYLGIRLEEGQSQGAILKLYTAHNSQYIESQPVHGYQSSLSSYIHFGLGDELSADSLVIIWPDGTIQKQLSLPSNQIHLIKKIADTRPYSPEKPVPLMKELDFDFYHQQIPQNDFSRQILLPQMMSYSGPRITKGDVNNDQREDFYIGGGKGQPGQLFIQAVDGRFVHSPQPDFVKDQLATDTDAEFLDVDGDGDLDLLVIGGGYEYLRHDLVLQNRIYINDGQGFFKKSINPFPGPPTADQASVILDFDRDGDLDLFVAGGCIPLEYPRYNPSRLYRNDRGSWTRTDTALFDSIGLIQDVIAADLNGDGWQDILAVGDWTGIQIFYNQKGSFEKSKQPELAMNTGFWTRVAVIDIENDGDLDFITGNLGLNTQYRASASQPIRIHIADFDGNGSIDPIMSYFIQGKSHPAYSRDELLDQLPALKKTYLTYDLYSSVQQDEIIKKFPSSKPEVLKIHTLETCLWVQENGQFIKRTLPIEAQFSPTYAILVEDLNRDGFADILLAGNQEHSRVRIGKIDANYGQLFLNDQNGGFQYIPQRRSGLQIKGDVRDIQKIGSTIFFGINNSKMRVYEWLDQARPK